jgi:serine-type D-Ala-D-Ala carboxypeptidase/endopeptidase (penicillin-binding protein 4)
MTLSRSRISLISLVLLTLCLTVCSAYDLKSSIDGLLADPALKHGVQGVVVESLSTGTTLYERNRDMVFLPASNFKLLVSATAITRLGPDFNYSTRLCYTGNIDPNGRLDGDLFLVGGGDPILSTNDLSEMVNAIRKKGIRRITGRIIGDDSRFDIQRLGTGWSSDDEPYYYAAQISALNLDRNVIGVYVSPGVKEGGLARVSLKPVTSYVRVECTATTGSAKSENTVSVDRVRGKNVIRVTGSIPLDAKATAPVELITMEEPAFYAAMMFRDLLGRSGVIVNGSAALGKVGPDAQLLTEHHSLPLSSILPLLNKPSDNLIAEVLLKTIGREIKGKGTAAAGEEAELGFLKEIGADTTAVAINDGSGLSRKDYISPGNLVTILRFMWNSPHSRAFVDSLPIAGVDGTLRSRMKGTPAEGNVRAKTGYSSRVSTISGYVTTRSGQPLVFCIMMNGQMCPNPESTRIQDAICELLASIQ